MSGSITGVVLAAGAGERMGVPKLLLPFRDRTVLNATLAAVETSRVDRVIVVTGANAEAVEASLLAVRAAVARNPDFRRGNMSSLLTATATDPDAEAFILVAGDQPTTRTDVIDAMVELWNEERPWAAVANYDDRIANPFLISRPALEDAAEMTGERVLGRLLIESGADRVARLRVAGPAPRDVNTPEEYESLLSGEGLEAPGEGWFGGDDADATHGRVDAASRMRRVVVDTMSDRAVPPTDE
jgi:molybdenum cofactor cytidylyltransferase